MTVYPKAHDIRRVIAEAKMQMQYDANGPHTRYAYLDEFQGRKVLRLTREPIKNPELVIFPGGRVIAYCCMVGRWAEGFNP